jgi:hypothetical protein
MNLVGNVAPLVGCLLFCAIAYLSVRRAHSKALDAVRQAETAAE